MADDKAVPKAAVMEASAAMLQKQLYAIFTTPADGIGPVLEGLFARADKRIIVASFASLISV